MSNFNFTAENNNILFDCDLLPEPSEPNSDVFGMEKANNNLNLNTEFLTNFPDDEFINQSIKNSDNDSVQENTIGLSGNLLELNDYKFDGNVIEKPNKKSAKKSSPEKTGTPVKKRKKTETESVEKEKKKPKSSNQRRNIKKVITENRLNEATLRALNEEKERQERLNAINQINQPNQLNQLNQPNQPNQQEYLEFNLLQDAVQPHQLNQNGQDFQPMSLSNFNTELQIGGSKFNENEASFKSLGNKDPCQNNQQTNKLQENMNNSANSSDQSICIIEEESSVPFNRTNNNNTMTIKQEMKAQEYVLPDTDDNDIIELNDDEDCMIISEAEHLQENQAASKRKLRGIHMNDELNKPDANGQVLINVNHPVEDPDICLLPYLAKFAKTHQIGGVRFMYDNIVESLSRIKNKSTGFGCILAHAMGLGKTFQVITFIEVFLRATTAKRVLCIVPINTIQNWQSEFNNWLPENGQQRLDQDTVINYRRPFKVHLINDFSKTLKQRTEIILDWKNKGGALLIGYEMFRTLVQNSKNGKQGKNQKKLSFDKDDIIDIDEQNPELSNLSDIQISLLTPDLVVCDEGHRIKNNMANIAKTLQKIVTKRRVVLTGYPLQNNLTEYWCMVDFVRPSYLGTKAEFANMFERPIMNGQCMDSTREDVKLMRYRAHVLHSLLEGFVQRRGHDVFYGQLTQKQEYIVLLKMSKVQKELYLEFMEAIGAMNANEKANPLRSFAICCKIWNHPDVLYKYHIDKMADLDLDIPDMPLKNKSKQQTNQSVKYSSQHSSSNNGSYQTGDESNSSGGFNPFASSAYQDQRYKAGFDPDWADRLLEKYEPNHLEYGAKFILSLELIQQSIMAGDKILLFSQSLLSLDLIEKYLQQVNVANTTEKWEKYKHYYRLDGSTNGVERERLINSFNKPTSNAWLFLLSTRAGCLGINLVGANRVIVLDASWNPCHDAQAVCRVYRYGQKKTSYIYRLVADHTMEKKIYDRQVSKQTMSDRVVDEIQADNHFTRSEVEKLIHYVKEDTPAADLSEMPSKFDDQVLINSCMKHSNVITTVPFTHESLLLDKKEYQLSAREKNLAFRDYHHEKKYFPTSRPSTYSSFYNRAAMSQSPYAQQFSSGTQLNPNINYSALASYNSSLSNSSTNSSASSTNSTNISVKQMTSGIGLLDRIATDTNKDLDFSLHSIGPQQTSFSNGNLHLSNEKISQNSIGYNTPAIMKCLDSKSEKQYTNTTANSVKQSHEQPLPATLNLKPNTQSSPNLRDVKITRFTVATQIVIPAVNSVVPSSEQATGNTASMADGPIVIQPGQQVYLLTSAKGTFLRTPDKKYVTVTDEICQKLSQSITQNTEKAEIQNNGNNYHQQPNPSNGYGVTKTPQELNQFYQQDPNACFMNGTMNNNTNNFESNQLNQSSVPTNQMYQHQLVNSNLSNNTNQYQESLSDNNLGNTMPSSYLASPLVTSTSNFRASYENGNNNEMVNYNNNNNINRNTIDVNLGHVINSDFALNNNGNCGNFENVSSLASNNC